MRIYATHEGNKNQVINARVKKLLKEEINFGVDNLQTYLTWQKNIENLKIQTLTFLNKLKRDNKTIVAYGAPAKGNTLLNYFELISSDIPYTVDRSPHKQNKFLPGSQIPIYAPNKIMQTKPDYVWILPWNIKDEIIDQMSYIRKWGGQFVIAIPKLKIIK